MVLIGAVVIRFTNFVLIDPLMSIGVALFVLVHAVRGMGEALDVFLEKTPKNVDPEEIEHHLHHIDSVADVHHLHIWSLSRTAVAGIITITNIITNNSSTGERHTACL